MSVSNSTIAEYLGVNSQQISKRRDVDGSAVVLIDEGIGGIKKHTIPHADLAKPKKPKPVDPPADEPEEETAVTADTVDYADLTVIELQELARDRDISYSGLRKSELVEALTDD